MPKPLLSSPGPPATAELQLGRPGDADNNREGRGNAELQLGIFARQVR